MPTHDELPQFLREWAKLTPQQQKLFLAAVVVMVEGMRGHVPFAQVYESKVYKATQVSLR